MYKYVNLLFLQLFLFLLFFLNSRSGFFLLKTWLQAGDTRIRLHKPLLEFEKGLSRLWNNLGCAKHVRLFASPFHITTKTLFKTEFQEVGTNENFKTKKKSSSA